MGELGWEEMQHLRGVTGKIMLILENMKKFPQTQAVALVSITGLPPFFCSNEVLPPREMNKLRVLFAASSDHQHGFDLRTCTLITHHVSLPRQAAAAARYKLQ